MCLCYIDLKIHNSIHVSLQQQLYSYHTHLALLPKSNQKHFPKMLTSSKNASLPQGNKGDMPLTLSFALILDLNPQ